MLRSAWGAWACETTAGAEPYAAVAFPDRLALVLGNEVIGALCFGGVFFFEGDGHDLHLFVCSPGRPILVYFHWSSVFYLQARYHFLPLSPFLTLPLIFFSQSII